MHRFIENSTFISWLIDFNENLYLFTNVKVFFVEPTQAVLILFTHNTIRNFSRHFRFTEKTI